MEYDPKLAFTLTIQKAAATQRTAVLRADMTVLNLAAAEMGGAYETPRLAAANGLTDLIPITGRIPRHLYRFTAAAGMTLIIPENGF
jgi:hypothetical protein